MINKVSKAFEAYRARVARTTGICLDAIPVVKVAKGDSRPLPGPIFASWGAEFVVAVGYPDDDGVFPTTAFRRFVV